MEEKRMTRSMTKGVIKPYIHPRYVFSSDLSFRIKITEFDPEDLLKIKEIVVKNQVLHGDVLPEYIYKYLPHLKVLRLTKRRFFNYEILHTFHTLMPNLIIYNGSIKYQKVLSVGSA